MSYTDDAESDAEGIALQAHRDFTSSAPTVDEWADEARESYDMYAGDQWDQEDIDKLKEQERPATTFNRCGVVCDAVVGSEINNRQETRFIPREMGDVQVNEMLTGTAQWVRDECDAEDEESDAFNDLVICGMGWTETYLAYDEDPDGKICVERVDPMDMWWDATARKKNLSDARWVMRVKLMPRSEAEAKWPDLVDNAVGTAPWDSVSSIRSSIRQHVYPQDAYQSKDAHLEGEALSRRLSARNLILVAQYQYVDHEIVYRVDGGTGQLEDLSEEQFQQLSVNFKRAEQPPPESTKQRRRVVRQAFIAGSLILEDGPAPCPNHFTLRCMTGKRDRNQNTWYGLIRSMADPQRWANKFFSQILHILNTGAKGGVLAEQDAFEDIRKAEDNWARADSIIFTKQGALQKGAIIPKPVAEYPSGLDRLMEFSVSSVRDVSGVNLELLGLADRQQAGVLEYQRRQSGITILAQLFDGLRKYRKEQGRVLLYYITHYIPPGRLVRIMGDQGQEQFQQFPSWPDAMRYDVIVDEAPTSPNQKEKVFSVLQALLPTLLQAGVPVPPQILDYAPIPSSLSQEWKKLLPDPNAPQIPPEVQAQMAAGMQELQRLQGENQELKLKRQEKMAEIEAKREETVAHIALKQDEATAELAVKRDDNEADIALAREKAAGELALKRAEARAEIVLKRDMNNAEIALEAAKPVPSGNGKGTVTRQVNVNRDVEGLITSATIDDVLDELGDGA